MADHFEKVIKLESQCEKLSNAFHRLVGDNQDKLGRLWERHSRDFVEDIIDSSSIETSSGPVQLEFLGWICDDKEASKSIRGMCKNLAEWSE